MALVDPESWLQRPSMLQSCEVFDSLPSTNDYARQRAREQPPPGMHLIVAWEQTRGRGQHDRVWNSSTGSLTLSLLFPSTMLPGSFDLAQIGQLSVTTALGIRDALQPFVAQPVQVKWPNDVIVCGGKVAGILIESITTRPMALIVGIGINANNKIEHPTATSDRPSAPYPAISLAQVAGHSLDLFQIMQSLIDALQAVWLHDPPRERALVDRWSQSCCLTGYRVEVESGSKREAGVCAGIDEQGRLILFGANQRHHYVSGTVRHVKESS